MNEHLLDDITSSNYLVRYHAANNYLQQNNIPHQISELHKIFMMLVSGKDKPTDEDVKKHQELKQSLIDYVTNYGKPLQYDLLSQEELNEHLLQECCYNTSDFEKIKRLVEHGADIHYKDMRGLPAYIHSFLKTNYAIIKYFLDKGADINYAIGNTHKESIWLRMMQWGSIEDFKMLLEYGVDIHATTQFGENALHILSEFFNRADRIKILLEKGVSPHVENKDKQTPLFKAMRYDVVENAELLLKYGAKINIIDINGSTPLHLAVQRESINCVKLLIKNGADSSIRDATGKNAYEIAIAKGFSTIAEIIRPGEGENDYKNSEDYKKVKELKAAIIKALKDGKKYYSSDKEGHGELAFSNGIYIYSYAEHMSDYNYQTNYKTDEDVIKFLYERHRYSWGNNSELNVYENIIEILC